MATEPIKVNVVPDPDRKNGFKISSTDPRWRLLDDDTALFPAMAALIDADPSIAELSVEIEGSKHTGLPRGNFVYTFNNGGTVCGEMIGLDKASKTIRVRDSEKYEHVVLMRNVASIRRARSLL